MSATNPRDAAAERYPFAPPEYGTPAARAEWDSEAEVKRTAYIEGWRECESQAQRSLVVTPEAVEAFCRKANPNFYAQDDATKKAWLERSREGLQAAMPLLRREG